MVLYSKLAYQSQFSGEKKRFKNPILGYRDIKQKPSLILFGTPCRQTSTFYGDAIYTQDETEITLQIF